jgi:hypothetical protein
VTPLGDRVPEPRLVGPVAAERLRVTARFATRLRHALQTLRRVASPEDLNMARLPTGVAVDEFTLDANRAMRRPRGRRPGFLGGGAATA